MIEIIVGGQYGGEGKGKIAACKSLLKDYYAVCRCGGVNSSHTIVDGKNRFRFRMLPTAVAVKSNFEIVFGAGALIHIPTLFEEMKHWNVCRKRIRIDFRAGIVSESCTRDQRLDPRYEEIGSTLTGTGYAAANRTKRKLLLAKDYPALRPFLCDAAALLHKYLSSEEDILVEGHQGAMLSNYHGDYPFTSSRDCTAAAMLSELGLGLNWPTRVTLVLRTFEIRNHQGHLGAEVTKQEAERLGIRECGGGSWGVDDTRRRVGLFDGETAIRAAKINGPNDIALTGADLLDPRMRSVKLHSLETRPIKNLIATIEALTNTPVSFVSTGEDVLDSYSRKGKLYQLREDRRNGAYSHSG